MPWATIQGIWSIVMTVIGVIWVIALWRGRMDRIQEDWPGVQTRLRDLESAVLELRAERAMLVDVKSKLEVVSTRTHELLNRLNGLPEALSATFLRREVGEMMYRESTQDRERLNQRVDTVAADVQRLRSTG